MPSVGHDEGLTNQVEEHDLIGMSETNGVLRLRNPFGRTTKGANYCRALFCGKAGHAGVRAVSASTDLQYSASVWQPNYALCDKHVIFNSVSQALVL